MDKPDVIIVSSGRSTGNFIDKILGALGANLKKHYNEVQNLPRTLPKSDLLVYLTDSITHKVEEQIRARVREGTKLIRLSRRWSMAQKQLQTLGYVMPATEPSLVVNQFGVWPQLTEFVDDLCREFPGVSRTSLTQLRHSRQATPVRMSSSLASVLQSRRSALRKRGFDPKKDVPVSLDVLLEHCEKSLEGLKPPKKTEKSKGVELRILTVEYCADYICTLDKVLGPGCEVAAVRKAKVALPDKWGRSDHDEISVLLESLRPKKRRRDQLTLIEFLSCLEMAHCQAKEEVEHRDVVWEALVDKAMKDHKAGAEMGAAGSFEAVPTKDSFVEGMYRKLPKISLADWAFLRQDVDMWPLRAGSRQIYYGAWATRNKSLSLELGSLDLKLNRAVGRTKSYSDDQLLEAAYDILGPFKPPPNTLGPFFKERMDYVKAVCEWYSKGPYDLSDHQVNEVLTALPTSTLTRHDYQEAIDLAGLGSEPYSPLVDGWIEEMVQEVTALGKGVPCGGVKKTVPTEKPKTETFTTTTPTSTEEADKLVKVIVAELITEREAPSRRTSEIVDKEQPGTVEGELEEMIVMLLEEMKKDTKVQSVFVDRHGKVVLEEIHITKREWNID